MSHSTEEFWAGDFGNEYTLRNQLEWHNRLPFWQHIIDMTDANSAFEFGCNAGWNLMALREAKPAMTLCGCDVNTMAVYKALNRGFTVFERSARFPAGDANFDITFTAGMLIHVPDGDLPLVMASLYQASRRYVLAVEYADEKEVEVNYRGHSGKLWRRPFGKMYEDMGLKMVETGFLDKDQGFDRTTYWLMEKPGIMAQTPLEL